MGEVSEALIPEAFKPLYVGETRYYLITGGRGSLKSSSTHDFVARLTYQQGHGILFTRYTMHSAEKSIIPEFELTLKRLHILEDFHITKNMAVNLRTRSFIYFSGIKTGSGDQTANLKSISGITTWVNEEGEEFKDEKKFDEIDDSIRMATMPNRIIWIMNATTKDHFIYQRCIEPANRKIQIEGYDVTVSALPDWTHIHVTYHLAARLGYLHPGWLAKAEGYREEAEAAEMEKEGEKYKTWYYHNYIGGWLEKAEGVIFENWKEGVFDFSIPSCIGLDPGFFPDPLAAIRVAVDKSRKFIYLQERAYETKLSTEAAVKLMATVVRTKNDLIVSDTSEPRLTDAIKKAGYNIQFAEKGPDSIITDIRDMQDYTLIVDPESYNLKKELNNYAWNDKKASIPIDDYNHLIDGGRYGFRRLVTPKLKKSKLRVVRV